MLHFNESCNHAKRFNLSGSLIYVRSDYALDFVPYSNKMLNERIGCKGYSGIVFDTLEIIVSLESKELIYPRGYFPHTSWVQGKLPPVNYVEGIVVIEEEHLQEGIVLAANIDQWTRVIDDETGWIRYGIPCISNNKISCIKIVDGFCVELREGQIISLWLKPKCY